MPVRKHASFAYKLLKSYQSVEEYIYTALCTWEVESAKRTRNYASILDAAKLKAKQSYEADFTTVMSITGTAMCPTLNRAALQDHNATEKLLVRLIPRPTSKNVRVGDLVACMSPIAQAAVQNVMVRRVAAKEGDELVAEEEDTTQTLVIPRGHCWVLADNENLKPPDVIDSRTFGYVPYSNIVGRVIYAARSPTHHHGVVNSVQSNREDEVILKEELDLEKLLSSEHSQLTRH